MLKAFSFHVRWAIANMEKKSRKEEKKSSESELLMLMNRRISKLKMLSWLTFFRPNKSGGVFLLDRISRDETGKPSAANFSDEKKVFTLGLSPKGLLETGSLANLHRGKKAREKAQNSNATKTRQLVRCPGFCCGPCKHDSEFLERKNVTLKSTPSVQYVAIFYFGNVSVFTFQK